MALKRMVLFDQNCSPYRGGEAAAFSEEEAGKLVAGGLAHYVKKGKEEGTWEPDDSGEIPDDTPEPTTEDEPTAEATAEGAEEEAEADDDEDNGDDDAKPKGGKRKRSKL